MKILGLNSLRVLQCVLADWYVQFHPCMAGKKGLLMLDKASPYKLPKLVHIFGADLLPSCNVAASYLSRKDFNHCFTCARVYTKRIFKQHGDGNDISPQTVHYYNIVSQNP